jgi:hypothetical protein
LGFPTDVCFTVTSTDPVKLSIILISGIHIFISETIDSNGKTLVSNAATTAAEQDAATKIRSEMQELPKEDSTLDLEIQSPPNPPLSRKPWWKSNVDPPGFPRC